MYQRGRATVQAFVADLEYDDLGVIPDWSLTGQVGGQRTYLGVGYGAALPAGWELKTNVDLNGWALQLTDQPIPPC